jgi:hypothetical protein
MQRDLHAGIVLLDGGLLRGEQLATIRSALTAIRRELDAGRDLVNRALRLSQDGAEVFEELAAR